MQWVDLEQVNDLGPGRRREASLASQKEAKNPEEQVDNSEYEAEQTIW
jgi:hypothetical protein